MDDTYAFENERKDLALVAREMFNRKNTNVAGGNISVRLTANATINYGAVHIVAGKDYLIMTPTMMSEFWYAKLQPAQILVVDFDSGEQIDGVGHLTREINMHKEAYYANSKIRCVYHSHAEESMFWATSGLDMPNVTEVTEEVGPIRVLPYAPATTKELADIVYKGLKEVGEAAKEHIFLLNSHGVLITSETLHHATEILETIEWNAKIAYQQTIFIKLGLLDGYQSCGKTTDGMVKESLHV
ncbi:class II aldolase/adducin family protein [Lacticaseibacillus paracasei]|uniref:class II aldolase/adducin family protein n=1 Tax=Lacticaseibacillus paracasei TaxID=1597 RepID=UPI0028767503|nr:class II aldolase/adducin family protein [Lacticaseibacillus paracasei]MDS0491361.1 class II aldolase/adducin family protein [Lacticaseibacillus paracasei]